MAGYQEASNENHSELTRLVRMSELNTKYFGSVPWLHIIGI